MSLCDLTKFQKEALRATFAKYDKDGNGRIDISELGAAVRSMGQNPSEAELQIMIQELDSNGDGTLDLEEFCALIGPRLKKKTQIEEELRGAFRQFDKDGDGYLDAKELKAIVTNMGEKLSDREVEDMIRAADTDNDGKVDCEEFVKLLLKS